MYKVFSVGKGTVLEREINMLMATGKDYIKTFEVEVGIVKFCTDMGIIYDGNVEETSLFFYFKGFKDGINLDSCFIENGIKEITFEQLKSLVPNGYSLRYAGSPRTLQHIGYNLKMELSNNRVWKIALH